MSEPGEIDEPLVVGSNRLQEPAGSGSGYHAVLFPLKQQQRRDDARRRFWRLLGAAIYWPASPTVICLSISGSSSAAWIDSALCERVVGSNPASSPSRGTMCASNCEMTTLGREGGSTNSAGIDPSTRPPGISGAWAA